MKSKEEIRTKWIRHTPLLSLDECVDNAMEEYANQCQEYMAKSIEDAWVKYREITNNEDAWLFKQWLVSYLNKQD